MATVSGALVGFCWKDGKPNSYPSLFFCYGGKQSFEVGTEHGQ